MSNVSTSINSGTYVGNEIDDELLGVNMRSHNHRLHEGSDFRQVLDQLNTNSIRFAGGTVSEEHFDITDPNATEVTNFMHLIHPELIPERTNGVPVTRSVMPLSDYLDYVNSVDGEPLIVMPTYRFLDQETRGMTANAEQDIRTFVRELFQDTYGEVDNLTMAIGNEFYQFFRFNWTLEEFGALQAQIAEWIDDELTSMGLRDDLTLLAQGAGNYAENLVLASYFPASPSEATVDGVVQHFYGTSSIGDPLRMGANIPRQLNDVQQAWQSRLGADFEVAVTEWNVGEDGPDNTVVNGLMRSAPILHMFAEMIRGGVDLASMWAARTDGPAGISARRDPGSELTPTGMVYKMLSESTYGMRLVDPGANGHKLFNAQGEQVGYKYTFEDASRSVIYFASAEDTPFQLSADVTRQIRDGAYVYTRTLDVAPGEVIDAYWTEAAITYDSAVELDTQGNRQVFQTEVGAYQLIELHVVHGQGVVQQGEEDHVISDELIGSAHDDELAGGGGWDKLDGREGDDLLDGGTGKDILRGKQGADNLAGGNGHDHLMGGIGNDTLDGGRGNDRLLGHNDDDLLFGGVGQDRLFGQAGNDTLDGGKGRDLLFGGAGDDSLDGGAGHDTLEGGDGADTLEGGIGRDDLKGGNGNDVLSGGAGTDFLEGGEGDDVLTGDAGRDTFIFTEDTAGHDRITDFGTGPDRIDLSDFGMSGFDAVTSVADTVSGGVLIDLGAGQSVWLENTELADLNEVQFIL